MKHQKLKSVWAVLAGFMVIVILAIATDTLLKAMNILPPDHLFVSTGLILFVIFYRAIFSLAGCYLAAKLAPKNPMRHAIALGIVGLIISSIGAIVAADLGPSWYAWTLALIALPIAWAGGKLYEHRTLQFKQEFIIENQT